MTEKTYWVTAFLVAGAMIYAGVELYQPILSAFHVLVCVLLVLVVLLQSGRAADLAGAFGGAGSQTAFGPRGAATFLSRATTFLAIIFMVTSLALALYASRPAGRSLAEDSPAPASEQSEPAPPPAEPAPTESPAPSQE